MNLDDLKKKINEIKDLDVKILTENTKGLYVSSCLPNKYIETKIKNLALRFIICRLDSRRRIIELNMMIPNTDLVSLVPLGSPKRLSVTESILKELE
jgi:hypothetical protein